MERRRRPPNITIREIEISDLAGVFELGEALFTAQRVPNLYRAWEEHELLAYYSDDKTLCLVAEDDREKLHGFVLGTIIEKARSSWRYGYIAWLGVSPRSKGTGVGSRLLARLTSLLIDEGVNLLIADTQASNQEAIKFFEKNGFGHPREHVYLEKNLSKDPRVTGRRGLEKKDRKARRDDDEQEDDLEPSDDI